MRRLGVADDEVIAYNLRDGGMAVSVFADTQTDRVTRARTILTDILAGTSGRQTIVEPGCSAGDISGPFSTDHRVIGYDVVPEAVRLSKERYPAMEVHNRAVEDVEPVDCDVLVLCEFLEHVLDPIGLVRAWLPKARFVIIGHPLVGDGHDPEWGHTWAYADADFEGWFALGGHRLMEAWTFPMGYRMVIGWGQRT